MHALIIEQDAWIILMIEDVLRELGYTSFAFASTREAAIAAAGGRCPDLITADIRLGAESGLDAVRDICSDKPVPTVFVTATPGEVRECNPEAVVVAKPFGDAALRDGVVCATGGPPRPAARQS
jgi:CheY-like chemotaxis protein